MLHAVTLTYQSQKEEIAAYLEAHKQWLVRGLKEGKIVFAGPLADGSGGYILFNSDDRDSVERFLQADPFIEHHLVSVTLLSIEPALVAQGFPARWAAAAKEI